MRNNLSFNYGYPIVLITQPQSVCAAIRGEKDECSLLSSLCWDIQPIMKYSAHVYCY